MTVLTRVPVAESRQSAFLQTADIPLSSTLRRAGWQSAPSDDGRSLSAIFPASLSPTGHFGKEQSGTDFGKAGDPDDHWRGSRGGCPATDSQSGRCAYLAGRVVSAVLRILINACQIQSMVQPADPQASPFIRSLVPLSVFLAWGMMSPLAIYTSLGDEIYPPDSVENWAYAIGSGLGVFCLIQGLRQRPRSIKLATVTVISSILIAATCSMMPLGILLRIRQAVVFRGDRLVTYDSDARIWSAFVDHYKASTYFYVNLDGYPVRFEIPSNDYLAAFGPVERIHPRNHCVRITVQRAGKAVRFIAHNGLSLPEGSLERCPASAS